MWDLHLRLLAEEWITLCKDSLHLLPRVSVLQLLSDPLPNTAFTIDQAPNLVRYSLLLRC